MRAMKSADSMPAKAPWLCRILVDLSTPTSPIAALGGEVGEYVAREGETVGE